MRSDTRRAKVACELLIGWCDSIAIAFEQCVTVSNRDFGDWSQTGNWSQVSGVQSNQSGSLVSKCSVSNTTTIRLITTAEWCLLTTGRLGQPACLCFGCTIPCRVRVRPASPAEISHICFRLLNQSIVQWSTYACRPFHLCMYESHVGISLLGAVLGRTSLENLIS